MNTPVSFQLAKLLKEKEWSKPTLNFYFEDGTFKENILIGTTGMDYGSEFSIEFSELIENWNDKWQTKKNGDRCFGCDKSKGYFETFSAPIISEVCMWLYEKHKLHIESLLAEDNPWDKFYYRIMKVGQYFTLSQDGIIYDSPTEAYEAAIEYVVKNLI